MLKCLKHDSRSSTIDEYTPITRVVRDRLNRRKATSRRYCAALCYHSSSSAPNPARIVGTVPGTSARASRCQHQLSVVASHFVRQCDFRVVTTCMAARSVGSTIRSILSDQVQLITCRALTAQATASEFSFHQFVFFLNVAFHIIFVFNVFPIVYLTCTHVVLLCFLFFFFFCSTVFRVFTKEQFRFDVDFVSSP